MSGSCFEFNNNDNKESLCKKITDAATKNAEIVNIIESKRTSPIIVGYSYSLRCNLPPTDETTDQIWKLETTPQTETGAKILEKWQYEGNPLIPLKEFLEGIFVADYEVKSFHDLVKLNDQIAFLGCKNSVYFADNKQTRESLSKVIQNMNHLNLALRGILDLMNDKEDAKNDVKLQEGILKIILGYQEISIYLPETKLSISSHGMTGMEFEQPIISFNNPKNVISKDILKGHSETIYSLAIVIHNGKRKIMSGSDDKTITIWGPEKFTCEATLTSYIQIYSTTSFVIDGQSYIACGGDAPYSIEIWNIETSECIKILKGHSHEIWSLLEFKLNGKPYLASASYDNSIKIWDLSTYNFVATLAGHSYYVYCLTSYKIDGNLFLASASEDKTVKLWDLQKMSEVKTLISHSAGVRSVVTYNSNGKLCLASGSVDKTIKLWDLMTNELLATLSGHYSCVSSLAIFKSGGNCCIASGSYDGTIKLWNLMDNTLILTLSGHSGSIYSLITFHDDENNKPYLISGNEYGEIKLWSE